MKRKQKPWKTRTFGITQQPILQELVGNLTPSMQQQRGTLRRGKTHAGKRAVLPVRHPKFVKWPSTYKKSFLIKGIAVRFLLNLNNVNALFIYRLLEFDGNKVVQLAPRRPKNL